jgi:nitrogen regulatory protein PII 2
MKEIIAIIRPKKVSATKEALEKLGFPSITAQPVLGRGHQRGIAGEVTCDLPTELLSQAKVGGMKYVPKRYVSIVVCDTDVDSVVQTLILVNQTAQIGDGKIFVCPVDDALRVRTEESGDKALI